MIKFLLICLMSVNAFALPESELPADWHNLAYPFYSSTPLDSFTNKQGMKLYYRSFTNPSNKKVLVILPGRAEAAVKYAELIYDLKRKGFDIHILDHQGQGESDRLLSDTQKGHVRRFNDYVRDFSDWINEVVGPQSFSKPLYLLSHSMGATIAVKYLAANPSVFRKAVLVSPMMQINTSPYSEKIARMYSRLLIGLGRGQKYAPGSGPYAPHNDVTTSQVRFDISTSIINQWQTLALGGPTARWVNEALRATRYIAKLAPKIKTPLLILQAGQDQLVKPYRQNQFCKAAPECKKRHYPEAGHEILMERDVIRDEALREILNFI